MKSHIKIRKTVSVCLAAAFFIALASGIVTSAITRAEFAAMLYRYMDSVKLTLPKTKDASPSDIADIPS